MATLVLALSIMAIAPSEALIEAGKIYPGAHVCESERHPLLMKLCREHAQYMAEHEQLGHQNFNSRYAEIRKQLNISASEIAAETWERQKDESFDKVGKEMFYCWERSPGHWRTASKKWKYFGADMAQGKSGIWYSVIIAAE